jgi:hypothetical protein
MKLIAYIILIGIFATSSCNHKNDKQITARMIELERQRDSLQARSKSIFNKAINANEALKSHTLSKEVEKLNNNAEYVNIKRKLKDIKKEYDALLKKTVWYKARSLPFEPVLTELAKSYDVNSFRFWKPTDTINYLYQTDMFLLPPVYMRHSGNSEDFNKIKTIIMKTLLSEPIVTKDSDGEIDNILWTGPDYDTKVYKIFDESLWIVFSVKKMK